MPNNGKEPDMKHWRWYAAKANWWLMSTCGASCMMPSNPKALQDMQRLQSNGGGKAGGAKQSQAASGEADTIAGWLAYGAALNEGLKDFTAPDGTQDDKGFGRWIADNDLRQLAGDRPVEDHERAAAMWAAGNPEQFEEAKAAGNARTVRVSGFDAPTPPLLGSPERGHPRVTLTRISPPVGGPQKPNPATTSLTKTVTLNALSRCFVCPAHGIMLNSNYGM